MRGGSNITLSAKEIAEYMDCSVDTVYRRWREWGLPCFYVGRNLKARARDMDNWVERKVRAA